MRYGSYWCVLAALAVGVAAAQSGSWPSLMQRAEKLQHEGNYQAAEECYRSAERVGGTVERAKSENELATLLIEMGRYRDAETEYRVAMRNVEAADGKESMGYAVVLGNLASLYTEQNQVGRAEPLLRQALGIEDRLAAPDDIRPAVGRNGLAQILLRRRRYSEAEALLNEAVAFFERHGGHREQAAISYNNLGVSRQMQGKCDEAAVYYERALAALEAEYGPDHPFLLRPIGNLAYSYGKCGKPEKAEPLYRRAMGIGESRLEPDNPVFAAVTESYAEFLRAKGDKAAAKRLEARARQGERESKRRNGVGMTVDVSAFQAR